MNERSGKMELTPGIIMVITGATVFVLLLVLWIVYLVSSGKKMRKILNEHKRTMLIDSTDLLENIR